MRRKLLLAVALAVLGTAITAGVVNAQSDQTTTTTSGTSPRRAEPASRQFLPRLLGLEGQRRRWPHRSLRSRLLRVDSTPTSRTRRHLPHHHPRPRSPAAAATAVAATAPGTGAATAARHGGGSGGYTGGGGRSRAGRPRRIGRPRSRPAAAPTAAAARRPASGQQHTQAAHQPTRKPNGVPTKANPDPHRRRLRARPARRPELPDRPVLDPALPAPHLSGLRHPVRNPLGGAGGDQPDRDRLRHQPQRLDGGRGRLDAVHPLHLEGVRGRRQRRRPQGSRTTRSTRSAPPRAT